MVILLWLYLKYYNVLLFMIYTICVDNNNLANIGITMSSEIQSQVR